MGYETRYLLTHNSDVKLDLIDSSYYYVEYGEETDGIKWYDHHDDMVVHSLKYPEVVFTLSGEGEESGDKWLVRYLGGQVIEEKRASSIFAFEELTRKKLEDEIINQMAGVFNSEEVVFVSNAVKRAFDKFGIE